MKTGRIFFRLADRTASNTAWLVYDSRRWRWSYDCLSLHWDYPRNDLYLFRSVTKLGYFSQWWFAERWWWPGQHLCLCVSADHRCGYFTCCDYICNCHFYDVIEQCINLTLKYSLFWYLNSPDVVNRWALRYASLLPVLLRHGMTKLVRYNVSCVVWLPSHFNQNHTTLSIYGSKKCQAINQSMMNLSAI